MSILELKTDNCKNCYKCVRHCPVKSIRVQEHRPEIIAEECILCGRCTLVCPQNAKVVHSDIPAVQKLLSSGRPVFASVAPSWAASFPLPCFSALAQRLGRLGFSGAMETAEGAYLVKSRYEELVREDPSAVLLSSCCPSAVALIEKHYPDLLPHVAAVLSPMEAHAARIRALHPGAAVVFLGPCISKKDEAARGTVDGALTFQELEAWLKKEGLFSPEEEAALCEPERYRSRFFPTTGGILRTMEQLPQVQYLAVEGVEQCMAALEEIRAGKLRGCFIEMSACIGSCSAGPAGTERAHSALSARLRVEQTAGDRKDYDLPERPELSRILRDRSQRRAVPSEAELTAILRQMGKRRPEDELNCGGCGYDTCRQKAAAVYEGKAEISMCLPFMKERAESFSAQILDYTPNAILAVDLDLTIQQINPAACRLFGLEDSSGAVGHPVSEFLEEYDFVEVIGSDSGILKKTAELSRYEKYVEQFLLFDPAGGLVVCIMKDITRRHALREQALRARTDAAEITDRIVEKQLRIVHEIASLLGETAAETKIALTELKDTIVLESGEEEE